MSSAIDSKTMDAITRFRGSSFLNDSFFNLSRNAVLITIDTIKDIAATIATIIFYNQQTFCLRRSIIYTLKFLSRDH